MKKTAEPVEILFGMWTLVGCMNHALGETTSPHEWAIFRRKGTGPERARTCSNGQYTESNSTGMALNDANWGVPHVVHVGATWQI